MLTIWVALFLSTCQKSLIKGLERQKSAAEKQRQIYIQESLLQNYLKPIAKTECVADCHPLTLALYATENAKTKNPEISVCTGVQISDEWMLTNRHCIPESIASTPNLCRESMAIQSRTGKWHNCLEVKLPPSNGSKTLFERIDLAYIKLDSLPAMKPLTYSPSPLTQAEYLVHSVDFSKDFSKPAKFHSRNCQSISQADGWVDFPRGSALFQALSGCTMKKGHSGSLITDQNARISGVLFARGDSQKINDAWFELWRASGIDMNFSAFNDMQIGFAFSSSCMSSKFDLLPVTSSGETSCQTQKGNIDLQVKREQVVEEFKNQILRRVSSKSSNPLASVLKYEWVYNGQNVLALPTCIEKRASLDSNMSSKILSNDGQNLVYRIKAMITYNRKNHHFEWEKLNIEKISALVSMDSSIYDARTTHNPIGSDYSIRDCDASN